MKEILVMNTEEKNIIKRLYNVLPINSLELDEFLDILSLKFTDIISTAAITCQTKPILLLNKGFIDLYCQTDEHLLMLIMHELYHIILGHTTLFPNPNEIDNIAFDAIINAMLSRMYPDEKYTSFFTSINDSNSIPGALLRPKGKDTPKEIEDLVDILYTSDKATYYDVYCALNDKKKELDKSSKYILIGNHQEMESNSDNKILNSLLDEIITKWPSVPFCNERKDKEKTIKNVDYLDENKAYRIKMNHLLRMADLKLNNYQIFKYNNQLVKTKGLSFIPSIEDRRYSLKEELLPSNLLYENDYQITLPTIKQETQAFVYLDVSGSVIGDIEKIGPTIKRYYKNKAIKLYTFSEDVTSITYDDFEKGIFSIENGTDVNCIFDHYFSIPKKKRPRKIIIFTDGYVGFLSDDNIKQIKESKVEIYAGFFGNYSTIEYVQEYIKGYEVFE